MLHLVRLLAGVVAARFKSRTRLEAEVLVLRHQLGILRRFPPLGYDILNRKLAVNDAEAKTLRSIFQRFLELGSVRALVTDLRQRRVSSKHWKTRKGQLRGGHPFSRGALYYLLRNRIYLGEIEHKGSVHRGEHPAILSRALWDQVQAKLESRVELGEVWISPEGLLESRPSVPRCRQLPRAARSLQRCPLQITFVVGGIGEQRNQRRAAFVDLVVVQIDPQVRAVLLWFALANNILQGHRLATT